MRLKNNNLPAQHIYPWGDSKRYNSFTQRIKEKYGGRVQKVSVNGGFTCPNRDGTKGTGGCSYCNNNSFIPFYCFGGKSIFDQIETGISFLSRRYHQPEKFIAYYQAYTNTYAPLDHLKKLFTEALNHPAISGLSISTRPDCLTEEIIEYLSILSHQHYIQLELGIESCYNATLARVNRGHFFEDTVKALDLAGSWNLPVIGHIIFGLPGESKEQMLKEANILSSLPLLALKFHQLQIVQDSALAIDYLQNPEDYVQFSMEEYIHFVIEFLELLNPQIAVDRMAAESTPKIKLINNWEVKIDRLNKKIESVMENLDTWQGKKSSK